MRHLPLAALALLALALWASPAEANNYIFGCPITIDDFDSGALPPANGPFEFTHVGLPPQSCAGGSRRVWINDVPTHSAGMVLSGGNDIVYQMETQDPKPAGGDVFSNSDMMLEYEMVQPMDLTGGGRNDRLIMDVSSVDYWTALLMVYSFGNGSGQTNILEPGKNEWLLSEFLVDVTQVTKIEIYFNQQSGTDVASLTVQRIRVTNDLNKYLFLDLPLLVQQFPPFDLPGPLMRMSYPVVGGGFADAPSAQLNLLSANFLEGGGAEFPVEIHSSDSGLGESDPGIRAGFSAFETSFGKADHNDGRFEFGLSFFDEGGIYPGRLHLADAVEMPNENVFYIPFELDAMDGAGALAGRSMFQLRVAIPDGEAYDIRMAEIHPPDPIWDPEFRFSFEIVDDGTSGKTGKAPGQPLFNITLEGDWFPNSNVTAAPAPLAGSLALSAAPSVFSDRTVLSLSRRLDRAAELRVFDLAGRLVRRLHLPAGSQSVSWNSLDEHGRSVASGVYVAQIESADLRATGKMTVLR